MGIAATGGPDELALITLPRPQKTNSELLVKVVAAGVNPIDAKTRSGGGVAALLPGFPAILGNDFSGVVVESPYEACEFQPGDEVFGMVPVPRAQGSYAEYVAVSTLSVARKPTRLTHVEAAAVPVAALTAWGMVVDIGKAHEGQRVLIHGAAGGVGHFGVQFAAYFGAHVIATGSQRNLSWLRELGAAEVVDYANTRFDETISDIDVVIDLIGNVHDDTGSRSLRVLRPGGLLINAPSGSWPGILQEATDAGMRATTFKVAPDGSTLAILARLLQSGDIRVTIDTVYGFEQAPAAHVAIETGHTRGKLVLRVAAEA
jgi:NADPH:quinone reductase-like Zn-dependent oxidoreductase